mgnify:CR=1 FL=1
MNLLDFFQKFFAETGIAGFFANGGYLNLIMIAVACVLLFLAIKKDFEPYLLLPIAFGMLLVNLPYVGKEIFAKGATEYNAISFAAKAGLDSGVADFIFGQLGTSSATTKEIVHLVESKSFMDAFTGDYDALLESVRHVYTYDYSGMFGFLYYGVKWGIYPCLIFLCIGATTDFGPLISNKKTMLLGAAAQLGIFITFIGAILLNFTPQEAGTIR